jgi:hypothetical protein
MTMGPIVRLFSAMVLLVAWHSSIPVANAQPSKPELSTPAPSISDQKLDAATAALEQVAAIQQSYRQRFDHAATPSDQERIVAGGQSCGDEGGQRPGPLGRGIQFHH